MDPCDIGIVFLNRPWACGKSVADGQWFFSGHKAHGLIQCDPEILLWAFVTNRLWAWRIPSGKRCNTRFLRGWWVVWRGLSADLSDRTENQTAQTLWFLLETVGAACRYLKSWYDKSGMADDGMAPISNCKVMKVRFSRGGQMTFRKNDRRKKFETRNKANELKVEFFAVILVPFRASNSQ